MKFLSYIIFRLFCGLLAITPFWLIYLLSDFSAIFLRYIIGYRKKVIKKNLSYAFPALETADIDKMTGKIYQNLSDLLLESIKGLSMSERSLRKRYKFTNPELLDDCFENRESIILLTGHYNNWEWGILGFNYFLSYQIIGIYKPLSNTYINNYLNKKRAKTGTVLVDLNDTRACFEQYVPEVSLFYMAADQSPSNLKRARWLNFLNQDTPCIHGPEKYAKQYGLPVVYAHIYRVKRGYYELTLEWICSNSEICASTDITRIYHQILEKDIIREPSCWLWSHRRWKHSHRKNEVENKN